jgi:copper resistance protein C
MRRLLVAGLLTLAALLVGASPAFAHAQFEGSDPADGASLASAPQTITLTFSDTMRQGFNTITVTGPDGAQYQAAGDPTAQDTTVSIGVNPLGPAGVYQVGYRVLSDDGHPITGQIGFTLTQAGAGAGTTPAPTTAAAAPVSAAPAPVAQETTPESGGMPVWPWIVGAIVLVGAGVVVAMRLGRSS